MTWLEETLFKLALVHGKNLLHILLPVDSSTATFQFSLHELSATCNRYYLDAATEKSGSSRGGGFSLFGRKKVVKTVDTSKKEVADTRAQKAAEAEAKREALAQAKAEQVRKCWFFTMCIAI